MLKGKVAVVTGSTSGIGLAIAKKLASLKCKVVINGLMEEAAAAQLVSELSETYQTTVTFQDVDLSCLEKAGDLIDGAVKAFGRVDILVNNAGIQHVGPVEDFPLAQWQKVMDINLSSPFVLIKKVLPLMYAQGWGRIINIASAHGLVASAGKSAYVAAKHGLLGLTKVVALEAASTPVTCNALCPGWVLTPLVVKQIEERAQASGRSFEEEKRALLLEKQPSGEFVTGAQLAGLVAFLCSEDGAQMRGSCVTMDGGWTVQ